MHPAPSGLVSLRRRRDPSGGRLRLASASATPSASAPPPSHLSAFGSPRRPRPRSPTRSATARPPAPAPVRPRRRLPLAVRHRARSARTVRLRRDRADQHPGLPGGQPGRPDADPPERGGVNGNRQQLDQGPDRHRLSVGSVSNIVLEYRGGRRLSRLTPPGATGERPGAGFRLHAATPQRLIPAFPRVGDTGGFSLTSTNGQVRVDASSTVEAVEENVTLGGGAI